MLSYSEVPEIVNNPTLERPVLRITGQYLARAHLTRKQRAEIAAALVDGTVQLSPPTTKQAAMVAGVSPVEVTKVRRNGSGKPRRNGASRASTETLAEHIARCSPAERVE